MNSNYKEKGKDVESRRLVKCDGHRCANNLKVLANLSPVSLLVTSTAPNNRTIIDYISSLQHIKQIPYISKSDPLNYGLAE